MSIVVGCQLSSQPLILLLGVRVQSRHVGFLKKLQCGGAKWTLVGGLSDFLDSLAARGFEADSDLFGRLKTDEFAVLVAGSEEPLRGTVQSLHGQLLYMQAPRWKMGSTTANTPAKKQKNFESSIQRQDKKFAAHDTAESFPPFSSTEMQEYRAMRVEVRQLARSGGWLDCEDTAIAIGVSVQVLSPFMCGSRSGPKDAVARRNFVNIRAALNKSKRIVKAGQ
jgi:hypothetical protein